MHKKNAMNVLELSQINYSLNLLKGIFIAVFSVRKRGANTVRELE